MDLLSIVVPVFNEEKNIPHFLHRIREVLSAAKIPYEIIFSLDPCTDRTESVILEERSKDPAVKLLKFSRRFGQPIATLAGIHYCSGAACVVIDVDLQDPPELIPEMVQMWRKGYDVVYAQRSERKGEPLLRKGMAYLYYWVLNQIAEVKIPRNTGDFRLMSRRVIDQLKNMKEGHAYLRGLVSFVGFSQVAIQYVREPRAHGTSNYPTLGSLKIALNGILGFSKAPLHLISYLGLSISALSFLLGSIYLILKFIGFPIVWGNPTLVILISFLSGINLFCLGIMALYIGRIYDEIKQRPLFIVQDAHGF